MPKSSRRPNLLLITTDQQRGDCLGCAGHPALETPYLDQLAAEGVRFRRAYTTVPACTPARAALLTGMDQWHHGRLSMTGGDPLEFPATMPGELARAGYHTQAVGKMHFAPQRRLYGFHHMVLDESGRRQGRFVSDYHRWFEEHREGAYGYRDHSIDWNSWMARPSHLPEHLHPTHWTASEAIRFLQDRDPSKPFFLWLSFARPHSPYDPPQVYYEMYRDHPALPEPYIGEWAAEFGVANDDVNAPFTRRSDREVRRARAAYYGSITFIDHQIGRVLYELQHWDRAEYDNTFILFTSDHGDMVGDHFHWRKTYAYEGSARVPLLCRWPRGWDLPRGQAVDHVAELRDVMPTLLDAAGLDMPPSVDGQSLLRAVRGEPWREWLMGEYTSCYRKDQGMQYVTDGREKYIWFHHTGRERLFNLVADPGELHDLAGEAALRPHLERWRGVLAEVNERRGDPRGQGGRLVVQEQALALSPYYERWKAAAAAVNYGAKE